MARTTRRFMGKEKKVGVLVINDKFVFAAGAGKAKRFRRRR